MKQILAPLVVLLVVVACGGEEAAPPAVPAGGRGAGAGTAGNPASGGNAGASAGGMPGSGGAVVLEQRALYKSGSRIRARVGRTTDGAQEFIGWFDSQRNEDCDFQNQRDGKRRCLPRLVASATYFADPQCTAPLANGPVCGSAPKYAWSPEAPLNCSDVPKLLAVGPEHSGRLYHKGTDGCVALSESGEQNWRAVYRTFSVGAAVPLTEFVEQTASVE